MKCSIETCDRDACWRGVCNPHYQTERRAGRLKPRTAEERFWEKVQKTASCWVWGGALTSTGYGNLSVDGVPTYAHRWSYSALVGPIPDGLQIDHLCRNRACVNPTHLEPVTSKVNTLRGTSPSANAARQTHCVHGHEFTPENTYRRPDGKGRQCRTCVHARNQARFAG